MPIKQHGKRLKSFKKRSRLAWHRFLRFLNKRWVKWVLIPPFIALVLTWITIVFSPVIFPPVKNYDFGVSFSRLQTDHLEVDWRANYNALLDDLQIRKFRLMSYWNLHEPERGQLNFDDLDWQMDEAAKRGAKVSLAIGFRQPRWPECHEPEWAKSLSGHEWKQALYAYIEIVVKRYENHPALEHWQLENEAVNDWFGTCLDPDRERLHEEFELVRKITKKPVWASLSDQHGLPLRGPAPDAYGYSIYKIVFNDKGPEFLHTYVWYPTPLWYHKARAAFIQTVHKKPMFIHELQLEPWGGSPLPTLSIEEQNRSMSVEQINNNVYFARQIGFETIYSWGGEWWYWRKTKFGDHSVWEAVRREINASRQ